MKILLIGPVPPPVTGVSVSNQIIIDNFSLYFPMSVIENINTNALNLNGKIGKFSWEKFIFYVEKYREVNKIFRYDKIYLTIGLTFLGVLKYAPFILLAKILKKEVIIHIHSDYLWQEYYLLNVYFRSIFKTILSLADKGIVLSPLLKRNIEPFLSDRDIFVVPNCVNDNLFQFNLAQKIENKFDKLRIVYLSNLLEEKGIFDLLEALRILKESNISFEANLAGSLESGLETRILDIIEMLAPETRYLGVVVGEEKKRLLVNSNVFVLPTYYSMEGQPISILEAMATGNLVLTTMHAGIPDIFQDGINGYYVEKRSPASIIEKLLNIQKSFEKQKGIALINYITAHNNYKIESFILGINQVLEK
ncbi:MAG: glycosyltransferase family 4 protein [Chloroflexi bacterium]|nr:glycosyltransferase family 4 protein [Chloroflexota bacterium]